MIRTAFLALAACFLSATLQAEDKAAEWKTLWDGKTMDGWKASEHKDSWKIEDGKLVCYGERSHLFYVGEDKPFKNFEFECEVMTTPGSNAGIYFRNLKVRRLP